MANDRKVPGEPRLRGLTKTENFYLAAFAVAFIFLLLIALLICWKAGWSLDSIKQSFEMLAMSILAFVIFTCFYPSLFLKLTQKFSSNIRIFIYTFISLLVFILLLWLVVDDIHRYSFNMWLAIFLVLIVLLGFV